MTQTFADFLKQFITEDRLKRFDQVKNFRTRHLAVVLENIYHAHNASACLRTCDCFGVQDVHVIESLNEFDPNPEIALGASKWLTLHTYRTKQPATVQKEPDTSEATIRCIQTLKQNGYKVLATSPRQDSQSISEVSVEQKTAIIFGAEQSGVSETAINEADALIHIPMYGFTESFNISVSVAIILRQLREQLTASTVDWQLTPEEHENLMDEWVATSLGSKLDALKRRFEATQTDTKTQ